jgi:hypothetical protein
MKRDRIARGWSLAELSAHTSVNIGTLSQVETGKRPMTEKLATACDHVFTERNGWYVAEYDESKSWIPPGLRSWAEHEDKAVRLHVWCPGTVHGLFQTEAYARVFISAMSDPADVIATRLAARMARQQRVLYRDDPPAVAYVIDHVALYRAAGSAEAMAAQMRHLLEVASRPNVTLQVLPPVAHPATASELIIADDNAAYCEHLAAGGVYTEGERVAQLQRIFATIRGECYRVSESLALVRKAEKLWTGASHRSAVPTDHA